MTPALLKGPMQRGTLLQKTAWTRGRAQSGGLFVSGFGLALCWSNYLKQPAKDSTPGQPERLVESGSVTNPPWLGPEGLAKYSWPRDHATWTECAVVEEVTLDGGTVRCRLTRPVKGWVNLTDLVPLAGDDEEVDEEAELRYVEDFPEEFAGSDDDAAPAPAPVDGGDDAPALPGGGDDDSSEESSDDEVMDFSGVSTATLRDMCEARGLFRGGTRRFLLQRLERNP